MLTCRVQDARGEPGRTADIEDRRVRRIADEPFDVQAFAPRFGIGVQALSELALELYAVRHVIGVAPGVVKGEGRSPLSGSFSPTWRFRSGRRERGQVIAPRLNVTSNDAALDAALSGFGITRLLSYQVGEELRDERLQILLEDYELPSQPVHIVHRESRRGSKASRALIDLLAERLREEPGLLGSGAG